MKSLAAPDTMLKSLGRSRSSRPAAALEEVAERRRTHPANLPADVLISIFQRMILERFQSVTDESSTPSTSNARSGCERTASIRTVRSHSSSHSLTGIVEEDRPKTKTLRQRLVSRPTTYADTLDANRDGSQTWAYRFDGLEKWTDQYEVVEVHFQNFASYVEREQMPMAAVLNGVTSDGNVQNVSNAEEAADVNAGWTLHRPPSGAGYGIGASGSPYQNGYSSPRQLTTVHTPKPRRVMGSIDDELRSELELLSAGRIERLAAVIGHISPLNIAFKDLAYYEKRHVALLFYFLNMLKDVRRVTLDGIRGETPIKLEGAMNMANIESLLVRQPPQNEGLVANEEILLQWLRLPHSKRRSLRARFHSCRRFSPRGMLRFIRAWQMTLDPAQFEYIVVDGDSMYPWEFVREATDYANAKEKDIIADEEFMRPPSADLPAYLTSEMEARSEEEKELMARSMHFQHRKGGAAIRYFYEDGWLVFGCDMGRERAAPLRLPPSPPVTPVNYGQCPLYANRSMSHGTSRATTSHCHQTHSGNGVRPIRSMRSLNPLCGGSGPGASSNASGRGASNGVACHRANGVGCESSQSAREGGYSSSFGSAGSGGGGGVAADGYMHSFHPAPPESPNLLNRLFNFVRSNA